MDGVPLLGQWHRTIRLFNWTGVTARRSFNLRSPYLWDQSALYTTGDVTLVAFPGDANADGVVNFQDLVAVAQNYNVSDGQRGWADGDFTFDGMVDFNDLVALAQNYGTSFIQPDGAAAADRSAAAAFVQAHLVPEPSLGIAMLAGWVLLKTRRR